MEVAIAVNFPKLMKNPKLCGQRAPRIPNKVNTKQDRKPTKHKINSFIHLSISFTFHTHTQRQRRF